MSSENYFDLFVKLESTLGKEELIDFVEKYGRLIWADWRSSQHFLNTKPEKVKPSEYKYLITFTLDPKKVDIKDTKIKDKIEDYIVGLLKTPENYRFYYSREHETTNTHWHVIVHRKIPFVQDKIRYYKKQYGNVDISRSKDLTDEHSVKYLGKEAVIKIIK